MRGPIVLVALGLLAASALLFVELARGPQGTAPSEPREASTPDAAVPTVRVTEVQRLRPPSDPRGRDPSPSLEPTAPAAATATAAATTRGPTVTLDVQVVDARSGHPIGGALGIVVPHAEKRRIPPDRGTWPQAPQATSDAQGRLTLELDGEAPTERAPLELWIVARGHGPFRSSPHAAAGAEPSPQRVALEPIPAIHGRVLHRDGRAAANARLHLAPASASDLESDGGRLGARSALGAVLARTTSGADGRFVFDVYDAREHPLVLAASCRGAHAILPLHANACESALELVLLPAAGLEVSLTHANAELEIVLSDGRGDRHIARPDREGRAAFRALEAGRYALAACATPSCRRAFEESLARGDLPFGALIVVLEPGETRRVQLDPAPRALGGILGIAFDGGAPAAAHRVIVRPLDSDEGARFASALTDDAGRFGPLAVPPGRYRIALCARETASEPRFGTVADEFELADELLVVPLGDPLGVTLHASSGELEIRGVPAGATLHGRETEGPWRSIATVDGRRRLRVRPGELTLECRRDGEAPRLTALRIAPSSHVIFDFSSR
ncbi:MAG: hypothetical protein IT457_23420 [Planctomycetes bacterium]|nr:hypothetical protein [Planctomycetota bacterium]